MNLSDLTYDDFWLERLSKKAQPTHFTKEEVEWAVKQTDYKYFGYYEFDDTQKIAVDILVWVAQKKIQEYEEKR